jgi:hypothetical protein
MSDDNDLNKTASERFNQTPEHELSTNVLYEEAFYQLAHIRCWFNDTAGRATVLQPEPTLPVSCLIAERAWAWILFYKARGFSGKMLWQIHLPKPIQFGPHQVAPSDNYHLQFFRKGRSIEIDTDLFRPTGQDDLAGSKVSFKQAFYHLALVRYQINDLFQGSYVIRPVGELGIEGIIKSTIAKWIDSLAALGVSGKVEIEIYLPAPIRRGLTGTQAAIRAAK